jgi:hypothetical protein
VNSGQGTDSLIILYHGSGAQDFEILGNPLGDEKHEALMLNVRQVLRAHGEQLRELAGGNAVREYWV